MAHISLPEHLPGITGPLAAYPDTAQHLLGLAEALLRAPSSLTPAEREVIATHVSARNNCHFCTQSHAAAAAGPASVETTQIAAADYATFRGGLTGYAAALNTPPA